MKLYKHTYRGNFTFKVIFVFYFFNLIIYAN